MKFTSFLLALAAISLTACSTAPRAHHGSAKSAPETVLVTYHVNPGSDAEFQKLLARAWQTYRSEKMVFAKPHFIVRDAEAGNPVRFVELFTWVSHTAPEHAPESVKAIWAQEQSLCIRQDGHGGIEGGEVEILNSTK